MHFNKQSKKYVFTRLNRRIIWIELERFNEIICILTSMKTGQFPILTIWMDAGAAYRSPIIKQCRRRTFSAYFVRLKRNWSFNNTMTRYLFIVHIPLLSSVFFYGIVYIIWRYVRLGWSTLIWDFLDLWCPEELSAERTAKNKLKIFGHQIFFVFYVYLPYI